MIGPAAFDIIRLLIIAAAGVVATLWITYGRKTKKWLWPFMALCWLIPVILFFALRFVIFIPAITLNLISLSLYLIGIGIWGGIAAAKLKPGSRFGE